MTSAEYFVSLFAKHAPVTLSELKNAALSSMGHVEDALLDMRHDLEEGKSNFDFLAFGWPKSQIAELNGIRFALNCALDHWPNMSDLHKALLNSF